MGLKVWLPLDGNLENKGESEVRVYNYFSTINNNGKIGKCYYFNGTNAYLKITLPSDMKTIKNTTIAIWGKGNFSFGGISNDGGTAFAVATCFQNNWQFANGTGYVYKNGGNAMDGKWHHVACVIDEETITTYLDGKQVIKEPLGNILTDLTSENFIEIGCDHTGGDEYGNIYANDFRLYDYALSTKEIKELSKGLAAHYKLDNNGFGGILEKDTSGYGRDCIKNGDIKYVSASPRYAGCTVTGTTQDSYLYNNEYINIGGTNALTISCWVNSTFSGTSQWQRIGGFNQHKGVHLDINPANGVGQASLFCSFDGVSTDGTLRVYDELSLNGTEKTPIYDGKWHHICGVVDDNTLRMYVDGKFGGEKVFEQHFSGISNKKIVVGTLTNDDGTLNGVTFDGKISDFRIYTTALSERDIKELYTTSVSIDNKGNIWAYSFNEGSKTDFNKNGVVTSPQFSNYMSYGFKTKTLSDGSCWGRIHYLDLRNQVEWFANDNEVLDCDKPNRFSKMKMIDLFKDKDNKYEFMMNYPDISEILYNRWSQTSSPNVNYTQVSGYTEIHLDYAAHSGCLCKGRAVGTTLYCADTDGATTWFAPIGQKARWTDTQNIPAANGGASNCVELWVRLDNLTDDGKCKIGKNFIKANRFIEI